MPPVLSLLALGIYLLSKCCLAEYGFQLPGNLLNNWDFEASPTNNDWYKVNGNIGRSSVHFPGGRYSGKAYSRTSTSGGIRQKVKTPAIKHNTWYRLSLFVKFLNRANNRYTAFLTVKTKSTSGALSFMNVAKLPFRQAASADWEHAVGIFKTAASGMSFVEFYLKDIPKEVNYLLDKVSLTEITEDTNWEANADSRINSIRKNRIRLTGNVPSAYNLADISFQVKQTSHDFAFGTAIRGTTFTDDTSQTGINYQKYFQENFEWATLENRLKWKQVEPTQGHHITAIAQDAIARLKAAGKKIRGHAFLWNKQSSNPNWVNSLTAANMINAIDTRISYMVDTFPGLDQWDVCNEQMFGRFYEDKTGNDNILLHIFDQVKGDLQRNGDNPELFLNEYKVVQDDGLYVSEIENLAKYLIRNGRNIDGVGLQSHHHDLNHPMEVYQARLDVVANINRPILITELSVHNSNVNVRANFLRRILKLYFSNPNVRGVILWGFSDQAIFKQDCALTQGVGMTNNAAGNVWKQLVRTDWTTNESVSPSTRSFNIDVSGFHGSYILDVLRNGVTISSQPFVLRNGRDSTVGVNFP